MVSLFCNLSNPFPKGSSALYVQCVPLSRYPLRSCPVVLRACLLSCSKLPIDSACHRLAQGPQRVAFVCSQPCPVSICYWDGLQCCHHPNQNKWTFVCCLSLNLGEYTPQKKTGRKQQQGGSAVTLSQRSRAESQSGKKVELQWGKKIKSWVT